MNQQAMQSHYALHQAQLQIHNTLQQQAMMNAQQPQYGVMGGGVNMGVGNGGYSQANPPMYRIDVDVSKLQVYAELCGDAVQIVNLEEGEPCTDVKIIMLKASVEGEVVKEVGIKISDTKFAVYREKGENYEV